MRCKKSSVHPLQLKEDNVGGSYWGNSKNYTEVLELLREKL